MEHNKKLALSTGTSRKATVWQRTELLWSEFVQRLRTPIRGAESLQDYRNLPKAQQDDKKDVGGFVGGTLAGNRRKASDVTGRDLITLDLDSIPANGTTDVLRRIDGLGCAAVVYSTRKHAEYAPRLRVIVPTDRTMTADEYEPAARKLAQLVGMQLCDPTTFEASRLMYWPSCCADSTYVYEVYDKAFCCADGLLGMYGDWKDVSQWPQVPGEDAIERRRLARQENPLEKRGVIGAFCRTYDIVQAMEKFLPGMYEPTAQEDRYTYTGGSTTGGAIVYDNRTFLYSHHATDPCGGHLVNAFDMVRMHRYGELDHEVKAGTPPNRMPSYLAMEKAALSDDQVGARIAQERLQKAQETFAGEMPGPSPDAPPSEAGDAEDRDWRQKLAGDGNGNYAKTINNLVLILQHDPALKGRIATDEFAGRGMVYGPVPWNPDEGKRMWSDSDDAGALWYMESYYQIATRDKLADALAIVGQQHVVNDVKNYLRSLRWDGARRVDTLLPDYLGADDTEYTRAVMRKSLVAAVARAVQGGVKYDYMPIFIGPQGIGKSTFLQILGREWFSDSLTTFEGKDAAELIQGTWINEIGELTALSRQETSAVKQFLSKREDIYRAAYGRRTEKYPRRCVFFGTTNEPEFLKDMTGNRRFWPVDVGRHEPKKSVWEDLPDEVDQVWAETYARWQAGEPLYLSGDLERMAAEAQEEHRETSGKEGQILAFLDTMVPARWGDFTIGQRKQFLQGNLQTDDSLVPIDKICAAEIWVEALGGELRYMRRGDVMEINAVLGKADGWIRNKSIRRYGPYGVQRGFERT
ncbi:MAG: virulence-associated E family protein [Clostridiales bacterium]|nr:virulence-associated E family protein [Clostridiales bacterium]